MNQKDTTRTINGIVFSVGGFIGVIIAIFMGAMGVPFGIFCCLIGIFGASRLMMIGKDSSSSSPRPELSRNSDLDSGLSGGSDTSSQPSRTTLADVEVGHDSDGTYLGLGGGRREYITHEEHREARSGVEIAHEVLSDIVDKFTGKK